MSTIRDASYGNTESEFEEVCDFLDTVSRVDPFVHWDSGSMRYWREELHSDRDPQDSFFQENAHVWRSRKGEILGLCISEEGGSDVFVEVYPNGQEIYSIILQWIENTWAPPRGAIEIDVFTADTRKTSLLMDAGYGFLKHSRNMRAYDLEQIDLDYSMPDGFLIRSFHETEDVDGRVALVRNAFGNPKYSARSLRGLLTNPQYVGEWDLMVLSQAGAPVSYCVGWQHPAKARAGQIEPVGTHAEYRRRGLAQAVIKECFSRMRSSGIESVRIASIAEPAVGNYLYESLSPTSRRELHRYRKTFRQP